jgi:hypothetical protein
MDGIYVAPQDLERIGRLAGWAPGRYTGKCSDCEKDMIADKRAIRCFVCATCFAARQVESMSANYRLMVYFAVATLHLYRKSIEPYQFGETVEDFIRRNVDVHERVMVEAKNLFGYELSHEQMRRAFASYLAPGQSVKDFGPATMVTGKDEAI